MNYEFKIYFKKSLSYPPKIILKKLFGEGFALSRNYFWYINDYIFSKELSDSDLF